MKIRIIVLLGFLFVLVACSKENIDEVGEISLHKPVAVTDRGGAVAYKVKNTNEETILDASFCTTYENHYFITPLAPCITETTNGGFSIEYSGDEQYAIFLAKENGQFNFYNAQLLSHNPNSPIIVAKWDSRLPCLTEPILEIYEETDDFIAGMLEVEFFITTISEENIEDPFSFCDRAESIGLVTIDFVAIKTESECD